MAGFDGSADSFSGPYEYRIRVHTLGMRDGPTVYDGKHTHEELAAICQLLSETEADYERRLQRPMTTAEFWELHDLWSLAFREVVFSLPPESKREQMVNAVHQKTPEEMADFMQRAIARVEKAVTRRRSKRPPTDTR